MIDNPSDPYSSRFIFEIGDQEKVPMDLEFSSDGKTMFVVGKSGDEINVYSLATAWSISTAQHK